MATSNSTNALVSQAVSAVNQTGDVAAQVAKMLEGNTAKLTAMTEANATAGAAAVADAQRAAGIQAGAEYKQNEMKRRTQTILNIDPDVADNELQLATNALNAAQRGMQSANSRYSTERAEYDSLVQKDFMSDPLGYVFAQLRLPSVAARVNSASDEQSNFERMADSAAKNINTRVQIASNYNNTVVANTAGALQEAALLKAKADADLTRIRLTNAEMENISRIGGIEMQILQAANMVNDDKFKVVNLRLQVAQTEAGQDAARAARDQANEVRQARLEQIKKEKDFEATMDARLLPVGRLLGMTSPLTMRGLQVFSPKLRDELLATAQSGVFGVDLPEALKNFTQIPGKGNIAATNPGLGVFLRKTAEEVEKYATAAERAAKAKDQKIPSNQLGAIAAEDYQREVYSAAHSATSPLLLSDSKWDTVFTPYRAGHRVMLDEIKSGKLASLKGNALVQALETVATTVPADRELSVEEEDRAIKVVRDRVAKRELLPQAAAAQIAQYYGVAAAKNADSYQYQVFGMQPQSKYYFQMSATGMLGDPLKADLMNPVSVEKALMKDIRGIAQISALGSPQPLIGVGGAAGAIGIGAAVGQQKLQQLFGGTKP